MVLEPCVTNGHQVNEFNRLISLRSLLFSRSRHMVPNGSGKAVAKQVLTKLLLCQSLLIISQVIVVGLTWTRIISRTSDASPGSRKRSVVIDELGYEHVVFQEATERTLVGDGRQVFINGTYPHFPRSHSVGLILTMNVSPAVDASTVIRAATP